MSANTRTQLPGCNEFYFHSFYTPSGNDICFPANMTLCLITSGEGQVEYQNKTVSVKKGDLLFFPKYAIYYLINTERLQLYEINILNHYFETLAPGLEHVSFRHFHIRENRQDSRCMNIYQNLALFVNAWLNNASNLESVTRLSNLFLLILKDFQSPQKLSDSSEDYVHDRISQIIRYITDHYLQKITVPNISKSIGITPQYFSVFFAKHFHMPFIDFLNQYRVNQSLQMLIHSDYSITEIAFECGFQTYKSYANAFQKTHGISPSEYRNQNAVTAIAADDHADSLPFHKSVFDFLHIYLEQETAGTIPQNVKHIEIGTDILHRLPLISDNAFSGVSIGNCYQLLQESVYKQLALAASECKFTYVHFRDPFCDLLNVYTEPSPMKPVFTWEYLDDILMRIHRLQLYPFIEIGYMPRQLAASMDTFPLGYHPCIGKPKSLLLWEQMIRSFLDYFLNRCGMEEMQYWRFGFWNSANIHSREGYWSGTQEEFFELYIITYRVFQDYSLENILGSPNFSIPGGLPWYHDFLAMCVREHIRPAFLDAHLFSCPDHLSDFSGIFPLTPSINSYLSLTSTDYIADIIDQLKEILNQYGFSDVPILSGEWNLTFYLTDLIRDTAFMATFVVHTWIQTLGHTDGMIFSYLSDISEQYRPSDFPFPGAQGLISRNGLTKPAYHALYLLSKLDRDIIYNQYPCLITRGKNKWHVLLYNISDYDKKSENNPDYFLDDYRYNAFNNTKSILFHGSVALPPGSYQLIIYRLDREYGCIYDMWMKMGKPQPLTEEVTKALSRSSGPSIQFEQLELAHGWDLDIEIPPHTVLLYEIRMNLHGF